MYARRLMLEIVAEIFEGLAEEKRSALISTIVADVVPPGVALRVESARTPDEAAAAQA